MSEPLLLKSKRRLAWAEAVIALGMAGTWLVRLTAKISVWSMSMVGKSGEELWFVGMGALRRPPGVARREDLGVWFTASWRSAKLRLRGGDGIESSVLAFIIIGSGLVSTGVGVLVVLVRVRGSAGEALTTALITSWAVRSFLMVCFLWPEADVVVVVVVVTSVVSRIGWAFFRRVLGVCGVS